MKTQTKKNGLKPPNANRVNSFARPSTRSELENEIKSLRRQNRLLKKERDSFRQFAYACVKETMSVEETARLIREFAGGKTFDEFMPVIESILQGGK